MLFHPSIIALLTGSLLVSLMVVGSSIFGYKVIRLWDLNSGSDFQLSLERKTYLVSTLMKYSFVFQVLSIFLFVHTVDEMHRLFSGAMCAAGTLAANPYGYPALAAKGASLVAASFWLVLNHTDNLGRDYPLIRAKYLYLVVIAPLFLADTALQAAYFLGLNPNVITSCCGSLFSTGLDDIDGSLLNILYFPPGPLRIIFYFFAAGTVAAGALFYLKGYRSAGWIFSTASAMTFIIAGLALISFISVYFYELPAHHCPFCILQKDYYYAGYVLYAALFGGFIPGAAVGFLLAISEIPSLKDTLPGLRKKMAGVAIACYVIFTLIVTLRMAVGDFRLEP